MCKIKRNTYTKKEKRKKKMKVNFIIRTKRTAMPKGIALVIEGQAEVPKGMSEAEIIRELKEYGSTQFKCGKYNMSTACINVTLK
jgi:hypothetical protein